MIPTNMFRVLPYLLFAALCIGCSSRALVKKGALTPAERFEYVEQTGALIPMRLRETFIAGNATMGMSKEMVLFLYGQPDRTDNNRYGISWFAYGAVTPSAIDMRDSLWNYFGTDSVSVRRGLVFKGDTLSRIMGDIAK